VREIVYPVLDTGRSAIRPSVVGALANPIGVQHDCASVAHHIRIRLVQQRDVVTGGCTSRVRSKRDSIRRAGFDAPDCRRRSQRGRSIASIKSEKTHEQIGVLTG